MINKIKRIVDLDYVNIKRKHDLPKIQNGLGIAVVSTPKGLMTDRTASASGHGGEVLCYVILGGRLCQELLKNLLFFHQALKLILMAKLSPLKEQRQFTTRN